MKMLLYCKKERPTLVRVFGEKNVCEFASKMPRAYGEAMNGKVVAECNFEVESVVCEEECGGYFISLKDISLFNYALELFEINSKPKKFNTFGGMRMVSYSLDKAPKLMMEVDYNEEPYIMISVSPKDMKSILNSDKDVIIVNRVLESMKKGK